MKFSKIILSFFVITLLSVSCKKDLLDVQNGNDPDFKKVYSSGEDVANVASGLWSTVFAGLHRAGGMEAMLAVAADHVTCSWGNFGMRDLSYEPRNNAWDNAPSYSNSGQTNYPYNQFYSAINTASLIIKAMDDGLKINGGKDNDMIKAFARFNQGVAYGYLALMYDKTFIVDEKVTVEEKLESASDYKAVAAAAIKYLDEAIALSSGSFSIPAGWLGTPADYSSADFKRLCNTMAARILSYMPRNQAELNAVDWNKVKAYADAGITKDFSILMDGTNKWYFEAGDYLTFEGWGRVDMYVANMLDPVTQPNHWDDSAAFPYPKESTNPVDNRLKTDFRYMPSNDFQAARGYYHFSSYRYKRYDEQYVQAIGEKPDVMKAENDMLRAEARIYGASPDLAGAAAIINAGTRVTRGQMAPVAAVKADLIKAIHHERNVEMYTTGCGIQFFEMRKLNLLQKGTPLHFPLPAKILETFGAPLPFYTFGKVASADGINTSNGGWR